MDMSLDRINWFFNRLMKARKDSANAIKRQSGG
jgi:hypothetical protein